MTTKVLDLATIAHALNQLQDILGKWHGINAQQQKFLTWYKLHHKEIAKLDGLEALASTDAAELNRFLTDHGFDPMFPEFDGIGVASILDMLMEWVTEGYVTSLVRREMSSKDCYGQPAKQDVTYPAFHLGDAGVYRVAGHRHPLLQLRTKTGHSLWLMKSDEPSSGLALNDLAMELLQAERTSSDWAGAIVPMLEIDTDGDVDWLLGMHDGEYHLQKIFQKFKLRANEKGARVKVATGMLFARSMCALPEPYVLDDPFIGFFTQAGHDIPLAAFWADTDVWRKPSGTLEEL